MIVCSSFVILTGAVLNPNIIEKKNASFSDSLIMEKNGLYAKMQNFIFYIIFFLIFLIYSNFNVKYNLINFIDFCMNL